MRHLFVATFLTLTACHGQPAGFPASARVTIQRLADLPAASDPIAELGEDLDLTEALSIDDTTIAVLDYSQSRVLLIDRRGHPVGSVGRHGGGPGEFQNPRFLVRLQTGFAVFDDLKLALVTFDPLGHPGPELSLGEVTGSLHGILTGLAQLTDGWVYAVSEPAPVGPREALYVHTADATRLLATTPPAPGTPIRLPCGISLSPQPPVFWPTLRWSADSSLVAYSVTAEDRVVLWDSQRRDSTVLTGPMTPRSATPDAAAALPLRLTVSTGRAGCAIDAAEIVRQRGVAPSIPAIRRILVTQGGTVWVELETQDSLHPLRVYRPGGLVDTISTPVAPRLFLTEGEFVGQQPDAPASPAASIWRVQFRQ